MKLVASAARYGEVSDNGVVALRRVICGAGDDAPFFDTCGQGLVDGTRGFSTFDYLGSYSASLQGEYRGRISERFGYVAFVGAGGSDNDFGSILSQVEYAGGVGLRVRISKQFMLDYAVDYAANADGEHFLYLTLGQKL